MKDILIRLFSKLLYVLLESLKVIIKFILIPAIFLTILRNTNIESWVLKHPIAVCSIAVGCSVLGLGISFLCTKKEISSRPLQFLSYILRGCGELGIGFAIAEFYIIPKIYELSVVETAPESITAGDTPTRVLANGRGFLRHGRTPQRTITSPLHPVTSSPLSRLFCGCLF